MLIQCPINNTPIQYTQTVLRTAKPLEGRKNMYHAIVGIRNEFDELLELYFTGVANNNLAEVMQTPDFIEELGDVYWYLTLAHYFISKTDINHLNYTSENLETNIVPVISRLHNSAADLLNSYKKEYIYGTKNMEDAYVLKTVYDMLSNMHWFAVHCGVSVFSILQGNANKLAVRYKDKWSATECDQRSYDEEITKMWQAV